MAVTTLTTSMAGAVNYTATTASSSDWASVSNSTYFYDLTDKLVYYKNSSGTVLSIYSAGGLTYFTEAQSTTTPNDVVNVDSLTAVASTTNADISIVPKGAGAFLLAVPDNTTTGGNKRGTYAVDLQLNRNTNTQVASGSWSSILGGINNTASGSTGSSVLCGAGNTSSNTYSISGGISNISSGAYALSLGRSNTASGDNSVSLGYLNSSIGTSSFSVGQSNTSSGAYSFSGGYNNSASGFQTTAIGASCTASNTNSTAIGYRCKATGDTSLVLGGYYYSDSTASGQNSVVLGFGTASSNFATALGSSNTASGAYSTAIGYGANTFSVSGRIAMSGNVFTSVGDAQKSIVRMGRRTTDATLTTLTTDNGALISVGTQLTLQNQQLIRYKGTLTGKQSGSTNVGVWDIDGVIVRGANAASTTLIISNINLVTNASAWATPIISADTTNGCLKIDVQGLVGTNIQWLAILDTIDNLYL